MKSNHDLKTEEGRICAINEIKESFLQTLKTIGVELADDSVCIVYDTSITLGVKSTRPNYYFEFASEVELKPSLSYFGNGEPSINFGSSGKFDPSIKSFYWRTIHAASILKNWDKVVEAVNTHCKMIKDLEKEALNGK